MLHIAHIREARLDTDLAQACLFFLHDTHTHTNCLPKPIQIRKRWRRLRYRFQVWSQFHTAIIAWPAPRGRRWRIVEIHRLGNTAGFCTTPLIYRSEHSLGHWIDSVVEYCMKWLFSYTIMYTCANSHSNHKPQIQNSHKTLFKNSTNYQVAPLI